MLERMGWKTGMTTYTTQCLSLIRKNNLDCLFEYWKIKVFKKKIGE